MNIEIIYFVEMFNMTGIQNFAKENIGILMSVLDSVWSIVKGNMSIVLSILTELLYIVLMSGSAVLNFTLSTVSISFILLFYYFIYFNCIIDIFFWYN